MNEEQAFLQAMLKDPHDLGLRLVFADWLEERGDLRGELLRLTHTLTQAIDVPDRPTLEARMQKLVDEGVPAVGPFWTNSIGMRFAWIPSGTFLMGSPAYEKGHKPTEIQHCVKLTKGFYLTEHLVTERVCLRVRGEVPVLIAWATAFEFCQELAKQEGKSYRLPTEAEWEYACRAGSTSSYCFGDDINKLSEYAWCEHNSLNRMPVPGQKKPNAWGLFDVHGLAWEWCYDWYGRYPSEEATDPQGPVLGSQKVIRGGSSVNVGSLLRSAQRHSGQFAGFRICFTPA